MRPWFLRMVVLLVAMLVLVGCPSDPVQDDDTSHADDDDDDSAALEDLDGDGYTTDEGDCDDTNPDIHPGAEEVCDGTDNDCDGFVDEDFIDSDGDGIANCMDDCDAAPLPAKWYGTTGSCPWEGESAQDPWDIVVEWQWIDPNGLGSVVAPAIANLTDDNGDGVVDEQDVPDVVVNALYDGYDEDSYLYALHGDGSGVIFEIRGSFELCGLAVADVDLDGLPEVVTTEKIGSSGIEVVAFRNNGVEAWRSEYFIAAELTGTARTDPYPTIADIDGDLVPEVVTQWAVFDGQDGSTEILWNQYYFGEWYYGEDVGGYWHPVAANLDHDGAWEIIQEDSVYAAAGTPLWDAPPFPHEPLYLTSAVADLQGDGNAEAVMVNGVAVALFAYDGTLLSAFPALSGVEQEKGMQPTIADFDGDDEMEIAIPTRFEVVVMEGDGVEIWRTGERYDFSSASGCAAFDFDFDGAYELICTDELDLRIYDGRTGATLFDWSDHASLTGFEYPLIADVDADGSAEIVLACSVGFDDETDCTGITVLGHADNAWPPAGPVWSVHDYTPLRIRPDGRVETNIVAPWSVHNMFKARPPGDGLADLLPVEGETCVASCEDGPWEVNWGVANQGLLNQREPISVALYRVDGETETLIAVHQVDEVEYGYQEPGERFELTPDQWGEGIRIVVDDDGTGVGSVDECDESNNVLEIAAPDCP